MKPFVDSGAKDRLINILETKIVYGSPMPWLPNNPQAVCFTECVWDALEEHTRSYSSFGVVFKKRKMNMSVCSASLTYFCLPVVELKHK